MSPCRWCRLRIRSACRDHHAGFQPRGGVHDALADRPAAGTGSGIRWSPDGARIAVLTEAGKDSLYLMNADGSNLELVTEGVAIEDTLGSPGLVWSPDGTRMVYATYSGDREELEIWNWSPDGSTPPNSRLESRTRRACLVCRQSCLVARRQRDRLQILADKGREAPAGREC